MLFPEMTFKKLLQLVENGPVDQRGLCNGMLPLMRMVKMQQQQGNVMQDDVLIGMDQCKLSLQLSNDKISDISQLIIQVDIRICRIGIQQPAFFFLTVDFQEPLEQFLTKHDQPAVPVKVVNQVYLSRMQKKQPLRTQLKSIEIDGMHTFTFIDEQDLIMIMAVRDNGEVVQVFMQPDDTQKLSVQKFLNGELKMSFVI